MAKDGKAPDYLVLLVFIFVIIILIQFIFFSKTFEMGVFVSLSLLFYLGFFLSRDKNLKRKNSDKFFDFQKTWFYYRDEKLPKNLP